MMNPVEIIRKKRDGQKLTDEEISFFVAGISDDSIPAYQATAFLMATYFQGMALSETVALTKAMIASGQRIQFAKTKNFEDDVVYVDKHSTGGIGDKISLILAPLAATLGLHVPMVAGRGLGHTGGTLDKLESIPGFSVNLSIEQFKKQVNSFGTAIMGQTKDFVPADKLLYSLRDVTSTVDCVPLITGSILSKKAAEGISGLVLDIKVGSGAFMKTPQAAKALSKSLLTVGKGLGLKVKCILTDMNQPLGYAIGNSLEVWECIEIMAKLSKQPLKNHPQLNSDFPKSSSHDIIDLTVELAAQMLIVGDKAGSANTARTMVKKKLQSPDVLAKFLEMCKLQGATQDVFQNPEALKLSSHFIDVFAEKSGHVTKINGEALGLLTVDIGGGRHAAADTIDPSVGIIIAAKVGSSAQKGTPLARILYNPEQLKSAKLSVKEISTRALKAFTISHVKPGKEKLIKAVMQ